MLHELLSYEILLASQSPRRSSLMKELGVPFQVVKTGHIDEVYPGELEGGEIARFLAEHKSDSYEKEIAQNQILLTADTIVWQDGHELGKPSHREEALSMISKLSGGTHQVYTGVCLRSGNIRSSFFACTDVTFSNLLEEEIKVYVDRYKPYDKAGAYGIQEWIGYIAVEKIVGSYFNVMGLPVQRVYKELKAFIKNLSNV